MVKRRKRLERGIDSLERQKRIHMEKKKLAEELDQIELVGYYEKEIESIEKRKQDREEKRDRKD